MSELAASSAPTPVAEMDVDALRAEVARLRAQETAAAKKVSHLCDRAEQKIRAAASKCERMAKKHEAEGTELVEKREELTRVYESSRQAHKDAEKYKFEWDRAREEIAEINNKSMRAWTQQRIEQVTFQDEKERFGKATEEVEARKKEVIALKGAGDRVAILLDEISTLKVERDENQKAYEGALLESKGDLETAKAALRFEAARTPPVCPSCGYQAAAGGQATRYDPAHY